MSEKQEDALFEYIGKIKNLGEYLARGNNVETDGYEVFSVDRDVAVQEDAFSIERTDIRDPLESEYYGELTSISRMIKLINDGDYTPSEEYDKDMDENQVPEEKMVYKILKRRLAELLKSITLKLYMGIKVPVDKMDAEAMQRCSRRKRGEEDDGTYEKPYPNEDENGREIYEEYKEDEDNSENEQDENFYLVYNQAGRVFYIINEEGKIIFSDIDVSVAMPEVMEYLYDLEMEKRYAELTSGKMDKQATYAGIVIADGHDEK